MIKQKIYCYLITYRIVNAVSIYITIVCFEFAFIVISAHRPLVWFHGVSIFTATHEWSNSILTLSISTDIFPTFTFINICKQKLNWIYTAFKNKTSYIPPLWINFMPTTGTQPGVKEILLATLKVGAKMRKYYLCTQHLLAHYK